jgi:hypothetical protein
MWCRRSSSSTVTLPRIMVIVWDAAMTFVIKVTPAALQLRLLENVVEVAAEKNATLVLPFPVELLRFLEKGSQSTKRKRKPKPKPKAAIAGRPSAVDGSAAADVWAGVQGPAALESAPIQPGRAPAEYRRRAPG